MSRNYENKVLLMKILFKEIKLVLFIVLRNPSNKTVAIKEFKSKNHVKRLIRVREEKIWK